MRERPASSNPSQKLAPASNETSAPVNEPVSPAADQDDGLDKYDISTLACTD
ncbi:Hypothetical protein A7982_10984 [Minicystis rosea]|nr:Hypothetical protein A7982_10984 [Minicystis rosea]